mgnify:CR=1 FL=1
MLKIKDSVDLNGLEIFDFEYDGSKYVYRISETSYIYVTENRFFEFDLDPTDDINLHCNQAAYVLWYLIQAGLVKKV